MHQPSKALETVGFSLLNIVFIDLCLSLLLQSEGVDDRTGKASPARCEVRFKTG